MGCRCAKIAENAIRKVRNIALGYRRLAAGFTTEWTRKRRKKCNGCPHRTPHDWCEACLCYLPAKILVGDEECRLGFWRRIVE